MKLDRMDGMKRTHYCGTLTKDNIGESVTVCGWVGKQRDLGSLIFIDLRDRSGIIQLAFDDGTDRKVFDKAFTVRSEFVLMARGLVRMRSSVNPDLPTGDIEIEVKELKILGASLTPPFDILPDTKAGEELRLKYRYLDLRRSNLQSNIMMRHINHRYWSSVCRRVPQWCRHLSSEFPWLQNNQRQCTADCKSQCQVHRCLKR